MYKFIHEVSNAITVAILALFFPLLNFEFERLF